MSYPKWATKRFGEEMPDWAEARFGEKIESPKGEAFYYGGMLTDEGRKLYSSVKPGDIITAVVSPGRLMDSDVAHCYMISGNGLVNGICVLCQKAEDDAHKDYSMGDYLTCRVVGKNKKTPEIFAEVVKSALHN